MDSLLTGCSYFFVGQMEAKGAIQRIPLGAVGRPEKPGQPFDLDERPPHLVCREWSDVVR